MGRERLISLASSEETKQLGQGIAPFLRPGVVLALSGPLGAGKTTFVQGIASALGIQEPVSSPTFVYLNLYQGTYPLYHFDLYRLKKSSDFLALGFEEYLEADGIAVIEWPERIGSLLPPSSLIFLFEQNEKERRVTIQIPENLSFEEDLLYYLDHSWT